MGAVVVTWEPDRVDGGTALAFLDGQEVGWISDHGGRVIWWVRGPVLRYTKREAAKRIHRRRTDHSSVFATTPGVARTRRFYSRGGEAGDSATARRRAVRALAGLYGLPANCRG